MADKPSPTSSPRAPLPCPHESAKQLYPKASAGVTVMADDRKLNFEAAREELKARISCICY